MNMFDLLATSLLDLLLEIQDSGTVPIVGGGYGIYLKREHVQRLQMRTLLEHLPDARATNDIDLFLQTDLLASPDRAARIAEGLARLNYAVIDRHRYWQFVKRYTNVEPAREVKIDLLTRTPPRDQEELLRVDARRVKPLRSLGLHGRHTPEAFAVEENPSLVAVEGSHSDGKMAQGSVLVPNAWPWLMMKLFAYRDHQDNKRGAARGFGSHHALDLYSIIAMMSEEEYQMARELQSAYREHPLALEAKRIVDAHFSRIDRPGVLRLRELAGPVPSAELEQFLSVLEELFD